jgi:hypothetical protein
MRLCSIAPCAPVLRNRRRECLGLLPSGDDDEDGDDGEREQTAPRLQRRRVERERRRFVLVGAVVGITHCRWRCLRGFLARRRSIRWKEEYSRFIKFRDTIRDTLNSLVQRELIAVPVADNVKREVDAFYEQIIEIDRTIQSVLRRL